jgi:hypothetical protein
MYNIKEYIILVLLLNNPLLYDFQLTSIRVGTYRGCMFWHGVEYFSVWLVTSVQLHRKRCSHEPVMDGWGNLAGAAMWAQTLATPTKNLRGGGGTLHAHVERDISH